MKCQQPKHAFLAGDITIHKNGRYLILSGKNIYTIYNGKAISIVNDIGSFWKENSRIGIDETAYRKSSQSKNSK